MLQAPTREATTETVQSKTQAQPMPERALHPYAFAASSTYSFSTAPGGASVRPSQAHPSQALQGLQSAYGNQAILRTLHGPQHIALMPTLRPSQSLMLQRKCACGGSSEAEGECAECKAKREGTLQRSVRNQAASPAAATVPPIVHDVLRSPGQPLDAGTRAFMEPRFGQDFSQIPVNSGASTPVKTQLTINKPSDTYEQEADRVAERVMSASASPSSASGFDLSHVRVHTDAQAAASTRSVNALAYTVGYDIVFAEGQYAPRTTEGRLLLAHELAHVIQQESRLVSRHVQRATIPYRQVIWGDYKGSVPSDSPFGAVTNSGIDIPGWKPKVDITDTKEACEVNKTQTTRHTAKLWVDPAVFDSVQAIMEQGKSWALPKYKNLEGFCDGVMTQCERDIDQRAAAASKECKKAVKPCREEFDKGSTSYTFEVDDTQIVVSNKAECSTKLVSGCEQAMAKHQPFQIKERDTTVAQATTRAECSKKFKADCTKYYNDWSPRILKHEQGHFDISNVIAGKARADLKAKAAQFAAAATACGRVQANNEAVKKFNALNAVNELAQRGQAWIDLKNQVEQDYDDQTEHGLKLAEQTTWEKNIASGLKGYDLNKPTAPAPEQPQ